MHNVLEWLEASASRTPDAPAFADDADILTFAQLEQAARCVGTYVAHSSEARRPVAVLSKKSPAAVAALMGIVYARGFYCVLDERQPEARLRSILTTLAPAMILVDEGHLDQAQAVVAPESGIDVPVVPLSEALAQEADDVLLGGIRTEALDTDPLYVNFTSGSTGTPKGVVVAHRSVIDFIGHFARIFDITAADNIANQAPLDFDVSVKDLYTGMYVGACVHLVPREYFSVPVQLMDFLVERRITVCTWAVSALCIVSIMGGFEYKVPDTIRRVIFSGEVMPVKQLNIWRKYLPDATFVNVYGPTEVTCNCTYYIIDREFEKGEVIPMGKAFPNESVFLLDEDGALVTEPDAQGEIYVGGTTLALGYYNDPDKTAAAFVSNPLNSAWPETVYRTGDLARYDEDGDLVYVGRVDHQIKHMGQRIELGEIEAVAEALDGVSRACCVYNERKKRILMHYEGSCTKEELLEMLRVKLPSFMVPNRVFQLDQMPLTKNGKIDRVKLAQSAQ